MIITRYNRKWSAPIEHSCPYKEEYELITIIEPISFNEDKKTVKEYREITKYEVKKTKWSDFYKSFDLGSPADQIINHLLKGAPLVTSHTLPPGDYTSSSLKKGADIVKKMREEGITLEMLESALKEGSTESLITKKEGE